MSNAKTALIALTLLAMLMFDLPAVAEQVGFRGALRRGDDQLADTGEYYDEYELNLQAGQLVDLTMESDAIDSYLIIVSPSGDQMDSDDYYTNDPTSRLIFIAPENGAYRVLATSYRAGESGAYQIEGWVDNTRQTDSIPGELAEGDEISWKGGEYYDSYTLSLAAGEQRIINLVSAEFDTYMTIYAPDGEVIPVHTYPSVYILDSPEGGAYTIITTSREPMQTGAYALDMYTVVEDE